MTTSLQPIHLLWLGSVSYWSEDKQRTFPRFLYNTGLLWVHIHKRQRLPQNLCCCIYCTDSALLSTNVGFLYCHQLCVALNTVTVSLWFHWKDFPPSFSLCGLVSGNGCGVWGAGEGRRLHRFACRLMLCLWERPACCEVNSCALHYDCCAFFSLSLFPLVFVHAGEG